jgi:signal transduction histidine kinase
LEELRKVSEKEIRIRTEVVDDFVIIRIRDNGPGMIDAVRDRLFEAFFTTKAEGKGTGLGLSISYQIITEKHGGTLTCTSAPDEGTEFAIAIPLF